MAVIWHQNESRLFWLRPSALRVCLATFALCVVSALTACTPAPEQPAATAGLEAESQAVQTPEAFARQVVELLAGRRIKQLASLVHPAQGLLFSPYGHINQETAQTLQADALLRAWQLDSALTWGLADGTGEPITLPIRAYFDRYVYGARYAEAPAVAVNRLLGQGNSLINLQDVFPEADFVEFHFPGFEPQYQGLDWRSLRIVMQRQPTAGWWLLALVNDQWTI